MVSKADIVESVSIPILMTMSGVESMSKVIATSNEITEAYRKDTILNFIMGVLMMVPGVGAILDAVGWTALRQMITLLGDIAAVAVTLYEVIDNPLNALFVVFGLLYAGSGAKGFTQAAAKKSTMTSQDRLSLGPIRGDLDKISTIRGTCARR